MGAGVSSRDSGDDFSPELFRALKAEYEKLKETGADEATTISALRAAASAHAAAIEARQAEGTALSPFTIGDVVVVCAAGSFLKFEGVVLDVESTKGGLNYTVRYESGADDEDGEIERGVEPTRMRKMMVWSTIEVGDIVKAKLPGSGALQFEGVVVEILPGSRYRVDFCDGSEPEVVEASQLRKVSSRRLNAATRWKQAYSAIALELKVMDGFRSSLKITPSDDEGKT